MENDYSALFALCLLHAISHNPGVDNELLDTILLPSKNPEAKQRYNTWLVEKIIDIITLSCQPGNLNFIDVKFNIFLFYF